MKKEEIIVTLNNRKDRSAWDKGITTYAIDLLENVESGSVPTKEKLLNGAANWEEYSYGGCTLIYDCDIAEILCSPSELKKKKNGELKPNQYETWLDVQARALFQACNRILKLAKKGE